MTDMTDMNDMNDLSAPGENGKKGGRKTVLIVVGAILLLVLLCCGGGAAVVYWSVGQMGEMVAADLRQDPVVAEHVGEIEDVSFSFGETVSFAERKNEFANDTMAFEVQGSKSDAVVVGVQQPSGGVEPVLLVLPDGTEIDLTGD